MPPSETKQKILIVDDERANLNLLGFMLQDDYEVAVTTDGREAHDLATQVAPDLILLDIMMPEVDGLDVCRQLKADASTADIPVIFITATSDANAIADSFEAGAADYICKPINRAEVLVRVSNHLALASEREKLKTANRELEELRTQLRAARATG